MLGLVFAVAAAASVTAPTRTDFGLRELDRLPGASGVQTAGGVYPHIDGSPLKASGSSGARSINLRGIVAIASAWGRVTSTYRSPQHNRRVGGVRNSFHLSGRAIDIARRSGVSHSAIAAAYRNSGYHLIESLDEGDHSHFAFGSGGRQQASVTRSQGAAGRSASGTQWKVVLAPK